MSKSTENELIHPNNTNGKKNPEHSWSEYRIVKGEKDHIHGYPSRVMVGRGSDKKLTIHLGWSSNAITAHKC